MSDKEIEEFFKTGVVA